MGESELGTRTLTVAWEDPLKGVQEAVGMSGLETLRAMLRGDLPMPPMGALMGMRGVEVEHGRAVVAIDPGEQHANNSGVIAHGGLAATLLDTAMWLALHSTLPAGGFCTVAQMNTHYLRAIRVDSGPVQAEGRVIHRGRQLGAAEGTIVSAEGKTCAHATMTCVVSGV